MHDDVDSRCVEWHLDMVHENRLGTRVWYLDRLSNQ